MTNEKKETDIKAEVWKQFKKSQIAFLATIEADLPKVRPVRLFYIDNKFWIATDKSSSKTQQLLENPHVEFCVFLLDKENPVASGNIRAQGTTQLIQDKATILKIGPQCEVPRAHFKNYNDPDFTLIRININKIQYLRANEKTPYNIVL